MVRLARFNGREITIETSDRVIVEGKLWVPPVLPKMHYVIPETTGLKPFRIYQSGRDGVNLLEDTSRVRLRDKRNLSRIEGLQERDYSRYQQVQEKVRRQAL